MLTSSRRNAPSISSPPTHRTQSSETVRPSSSCSRYKISFHFQSQKNLPSQTREIVCIPVQFRHSGMFQCARAHIRESSPDLVERQPTGQWARFSSCPTRQKVQSQERRKKSLQWGKKYNFQACSNLECDSKSYVDRFWNVPRRVGGRTKRWPQCAARALHLF